MAITNQAKADFITNAKTYIENAAADPYIQQQILAIGYDENRLNEGRLLQEKAETTRERQLRLRNRARSLHSQMQEAFAISYRRYLDDVRLFRSTFIRDIPIKEKLGLYGPSRRKMSWFLERSRTMYNTLLKEPALLDQVKKFNFTVESIQEKLAEIEAVEKAYMASEDAEMAAQDATDENNKEYEKLLDWIRELQDACRIVLKGKPQLLEKVGILVRSSKPSRNKETEG
jgi:hypothetical protein